jgi:hypothetical protein
MGVPVVCATIRADEMAFISPIGATVRLWAAVVVMLRMRVLYCKNAMSMLAWLRAGTRESISPTLSTRRVSSMFTYACRLTSVGAPSTLCEHTSMSPGKRSASGGLPIHSVVGWRACRLARAGAGGAVGGSVVRLAGGSVGCPAALGGTAGLVHVLGRVGGVWGGCVCGSGFIAYMCRGGRGVAERT